MAEVFLVVGLGNHGAEYERTVHNLGFRAVQELARRLDMDIKRKECESLTASAPVNGCKLILALPQTYMNLSGFAVQKLVHKYKIPLDNVIVVFDDVDLPKGALRFRSCGSGGTHNGIKNIVELLGQEIPRLKIGAGKPPERMDLKDYVLSKICDEDKNIFEDAIKRAADYLMDKLRTLCGL